MQNSSFLIQNSSFVLTPDIASLPRADHPRAASLGGLLGVRNRRQELILVRLRDWGKIRHFKCRFHHFRYTIHHFKCKIHRTLIRAVDRLEGEVHEPFVNFVFCVAIYGVNGMVGIDMR